MVRLQRRPRPQIPPPRPILEVHWCQSGRKRAQPKAVSVMTMKSGQNRTPPTAGKPENHRDAEPACAFSIDGREIRDRRDVFLYFFGNTRYAHNDSRFSWT